MNHYLEVAPWEIIETGFQAENNLVSESVFSLGNGYMGQRANFEERYSGDTLQGNYMAGIYYPDPTIVGWWKIGYPDYYAKVLNSTNWIGIDVKVNGSVLDLARCKIKEFKRILNMKKGYLKRGFTVELTNGNCIKVDTSRFISMARAETAALRYSIKALNFSGKLEITPYLDGDVINQDANYGEKFWDEIDKGVHGSQGYLMLKTKKLDFHICTYMDNRLLMNGNKINPAAEIIEKEKYIANLFTVNINQGDQFTLYKYVTNTSSFYYPAEDLREVSEELSKKVVNVGFEGLLNEQADAWAEKWQKSDIKIEGDPAAQQGIRFNIFQLNQTYTGEDERLNIGPKGFTGEKYGGSTYWDTEGFCLPYYLSTAEESVAKNLLLYRYHHLEKAQENAKKLGFENGAALYPMVTINGEECHNEWEITFEEIHRNGAIAYAIYNYVNYTGDTNYLFNYGLELLIAISRFWAQRVNFSEKKDSYVILGVTGPNEYENNVNNNWYTNRIAVWTLEYTLKTTAHLVSRDPDKLIKIEKELSLTEEEKENWQEIIDKMYLPYDKEKGIFLQQDNYLDKEQIYVRDLNKEELPLNQNWSWDRILRSCFIKQADVLQGIYFFEDSYDIDTIRRNFNFYEPRTVHESSLSPCIHAIIAAKIKDYDKAYQMYLRTSRLDLDNYNNDTEDGCHITSMAGTWMSVVQGFGGLRVRNNILILNPFLPKKWLSYSFRINFRGVLLNILINSKELSIYNDSQQRVTIKIYNKEYKMEGEEHFSVNL